MKDILDNKKLDVKGDDLRKLKKIKAIKDNKEVGDI